MDFSRRMSVCPNLECGPSSKGRVIVNVQDRLGWPEPGTPQRDHETEKGNVSKQDIPHCSTCFETSRPLENGWLIANHISDVENPRCLPVVDFQHMSCCLFLLRCLFRFRFSSFLN